MFLVTGSGHSGTGWASRFFTELGFPCGHETYFNFNLTTTQSDSSWFAIKYLDQVDCPIIHLVRDPISVVKSFMRSGTYRDLNPKCKYVRYTYEHFPGLRKEKTELGRCIIRTCDWDQPVEEHDNLRVKIEDTALTSEHWEKVVSDMVYYATGENVPLIKIEKALKEVGNKHNAHASRKKDNIALAQILEHPLGYKIEKRAQKFGYILGAKRET